MCTLFIQEGVTVNNEGGKMSRDLYDLNPDHTHFVMVETETNDDKEKMQYVEFRFSFEKLLQCQLGRPRRYRRLLSFGKIFFLQK